MEYLHVLSRPMVINHDHDIIWTEAYMDSVVSYFRLVSVILKSVSIIFGTFSNCHFMLALFLPFPPSVTKHTRGMLIVPSACLELLVLQKSSQCFYWCHHQRITYQLPVKPNVAFCSLPVFLSIFGFILAYLFTDLASSSSQKCFAISKRYAALLQLNLLIVLILFHFPTSVTIIQLCLSN